MKQQVEEEKRRKGEKENSFRTPKSSFPDSHSARTQWITARRGPKNRLDPNVPYAYLWEEELDAQGDLVPTATLFLTNQECPFRCLMCDLWQNTLDASVSAGAIPAQILYALDRLPPARQIKLYNAGSFFDPRAIPPEDDAAIAEHVSSFERVIVEAHPAFIGSRCYEFQQRLAGQLEVAIGLETAHPQVLQALNKRFTVEDFRVKANWLRQWKIDLRVFLLVRPPFMSEAEGLEWAKRSLDVAFDSGASVCCLIPTRDGNGAMEALREAGQFTLPSLRSLEAAQEYGIGAKRGRVFADLWDVEKFYACDCSPARAARMAAMNRLQQIPFPISCDQCRTYQEQ